MIDVRPSADSGSSESDETPAERDAPEQPTSSGRSTKSGRDRGGRRSRSSSPPVSGRRKGKHYAVEVTPPRFSLWGTAPVFSSAYPAELKRYIRAKEYTEIVDHINDTLNQGHQTNRAIFYAATLFFTAGATGLMVQRLVTKSTELIMGDPLSIACLVALLLSLVLFVLTRVFHSRHQENAQAAMAYLEKVNRNPETFRWEFRAQEEMHEEDMYKWRLDIYYQ